MVLYVDNHLLVVAKPPCLPTVPDASGDPSLLEIARAWVAIEFDKPGAAFLGVVHRLDRPVSGVIVFARTSKAAERLSRQFRARSLAKVYWAVSARAPREPSGELEQWLAKDTERNVVRAFARERPGALRALTRWRTLARAGGRTLLELVPETGRPHQLRVASRALGAPLLGDLKYGADAPLPDKSIALHARSLALEHPTSKRQHLFECPPPARPWWRFAAI